MSVKHPIIAVTGSSGAGTTTVMKSFAHIFRREGLKAQVIEGDSFHRFDRVEMRERVRLADRGAGPPISHFGPEANLLDELAANMAEYGATGGGKVATVDEADSATGQIMTVQALSILLSGHPPASYGVHPGTAPSPAPTPSATPTATTTAPHARNK